MTALTTPPGATSDPRLARCDPVGAVVLMATSALGQL